MLNNVIKFSGGRLRPHFMDVCKPNIDGSTIDVSHYCILHTILYYCTILNPPWRVTYLSKILEEAYPVNFPGSIPPMKLIYTYKYFFQFSDVSICGTELDPKYVTKFKCDGNSELFDGDEDETEKRIRETRLSFLSGHASLSW